MNEVFECNLLFPKTILRNGSTKELSGQLKTNAETGLMSH